MHPTLTLLKRIERAEGKLDPELRKLCDQYAVGILGSKKYAPWLYVYALIAGRFKEGWIPDNYYAGIVVPSMKGPYGYTSDLKGWQSSLLTTNFPDILYRVNGLFFDTERRVVSCQEAVNVIFSSRDEVVFKIDQGKQGNGIQVIRSGDLTGQDLCSWPNGVFQWYIDQHPALARFHPDSVATLRLTTAVTDSGAIALRAAYIRFGTGSDSHVKSASHLRVPVDISNGTLTEFGYTADWIKTDRHPDTGGMFSGSTIPSFSGCVVKVLEAHSEIPFVRCVGWDVTVDNSGAVHILEWNGAHNDIKFSEATQGPCFADLGWETLWRVQ